MGFRTINQLHNMQRHDMPKYNIEHARRFEEDIENRIALMRSLQNLADLTADATEVSNQNKIEDYHCGFEGIDEVQLN